MTDRHIRAMLRRATQAGILTGWQGPHVGGTYCIVPANGDAEERPVADVIEYVRSLEAAGLAPLYRASEPT